MVEIRTAAEQLATEQQERATSAARVEELVVELERVLTRHGVAARNGKGAAVNGNGAAVRTGGQRA
jgi:hypothetical protein